MAISVFWERSYAEIREILLKGWWNLCLPHTDGGKAKDLSTSDNWRLYGCCFETTISLETWFKVLLKRKFKVAVFYLKYFFIPRSLITKNNATLRPRSRRDRCLKCGTKEGQNLKMESVNLSADNHTSDVTWLSRKAKGCHCWYNPLFFFLIYLFILTNNKLNTSKKWQKTEKKNHTSIERRAAG